jgi:hypothetical protein
MGFGPDFDGIIQKAKTCVDRKMLFWDFSLLGAGSCP